MDVIRMVKNITENTDTFRDAFGTRNPRVLMSLLGPATRGYLLQRGKQAQSTDVATGYNAHFVWDYDRDQPELAKLYAAAKAGQWDADTALDWSTAVDPLNHERELIPEELLPLPSLPSYAKLSERERAEQRHALLAWMLSQFLHGEQGALFAACQVTEAVQWIDGKLYGSTQVVDEGRHVEVFHRYLSEKLQKSYPINDNLYVMLDLLMTDPRWDIKFLGMQIMIEGLALGAFGTIRAATKEPLLKELLRNVITDEARHVHYGVVALGDFYTKELSQKDREEREDWAFEMALLMRNRFLAHEFYDEYYAHEMSRATWNQILFESEFMNSFRRTMFRRIVPNLKRIGLLSERIRPHYAEIGLLEWEHEKSADQLSATELLQ